MKKFAYLLCLIVLGLMSAGAQPNTPFGGTPRPFRPPGIPATDQDTDLTAFNLDFPGGTPADLVAAIEKATGKPLNAIISTEDADTQLPPLKMNDVVAPKLFAALETASYRQEAVQTSSFGNSYSIYQTGFGFKTSDSHITDASIWYFHVDKPSLPPVVSTESVCRFYQLQSYLNHGFTVEDITTAIDTGWKMAGVSKPPQLNYHKETHLLIAFGKPDDLAIIKNVLDTLPGIYLDSNQWNGQVQKINGLESQVKELSEQVSFLTTNSTAKSSGK